MGRAALLVLALAGHAVAGVAEVRLEAVLGGRAFVEPVFALQAPSDPAHWYVVERAGRVLRVAVSDDVAPPEVAVDISARVDSRWGYAGLLGAAFEPDGRGLVLSFTERVGRVLWSRVERFPFADGVADATRPLRVLSLEQPTAQHNNGAVAFGPEGALYIGFGDGQLGGDPPNHAQRLDNWFGKILRVRLGTDPATPYTAPTDNPFVGRAGARPEIWALGLRNPWRFSFDAQTGALWAGDVGQATREEVDLIERGGNYGWPAREGTECFRRSLCHKVSDVIPPVTEYDHTVGISVTGGYVYRGHAASGLLGDYVFGDYATGRIWAVRPEGAGWARREIFRGKVSIASFAEGLDGELYVVSYRKDRPALQRMVPVVAARGEIDGAAVRVAP